MSLCVALPDTCLEDCKDQRSKTEKIGSLARALAIFKVDRLLIYRSVFGSEVQSQKNQNFLNLLFSYIETPQYLRKRLFRHQNALKFAGLLPPLATPHHQVDVELRKGEIRDGVLFLDEGTPVVDVGGPHPLNIRNPPKFSLKDKQIRVYARIDAIKPGKEELEAYLIPPEKARSENYRGYRVTKSHATLSKVMKTQRDSFVTIATSRKCKSFKSSTREEIPSNKPVLVFFGSPYYGIPEMLKVEGEKIGNLVDFCFNILEDPGTRSIRLEEAILVSLSRLSFK